MKGKMDNDFYPTSDIWIASALHSLGHKLLTVSKADQYGKRYDFIFDQTNNLEEDVIKYMSNDLKVQPRRMMESYKQLKNEVFNAKALERMNNAR